MKPLIGYGSDVSARVLHYLPAMRHPLGRIRRHLGLLLLRSTNCLLEYHSREVLQVKRRLVVNFRSFLTTGPNVMGVQKRHAYMATGQGLVQLRIRGGAGAIFQDRETSETLRRLLQSIPDHKDRVRKASYQGSAIILMNERVHLGMVADSFHTRINRTQELLSQPDSSTLVPDISFRNIEFGFWRDKAHTAWWSSRVGQLFKLRTRFHRVQPAVGPA